jgi:RHS repeat-associated protein
VIESGNRLRRLGEYQIDYDADGNMTRKYKLAPSGTLVWDQTLSWNSLGQLTSTTTNGSTVSFGYDGWGRRVRKAGPSGTVRYLWDGAALFAELDASGNRVTEYTYSPGIDHPHSMRRGGGGQLYYYVSERPGHVVALLDASGIVVDHYEYTAFGESTVATGTVPNALRFAAREQDAETGLYYNRARYYDPMLGRFVSEDPIGLSGGINQYAYVDNAPLDGRDPSGLCRADQLIIEQGPDGTWKARCPPGAEYMQLRVPSVEHDYFAEIDAYVRDLTSRTDKFREETARALAQAREEANSALADAQLYATTQGAILTVNLIQTIHDPLYAPRTCWARMQQRFAKETVKGALAGIGTAAVRNAVMRAPLKEGLAVAGTGGAAVGVLFALDGIEAVCQ